MTEKQCVDCWKVKPLEEFYNQRRCIADKRPRCKKCDNKNVNEWKKNNKQRVRSKTLERTYGMFLEELEEIFNSQNEQCAICRTELSFWDSDTCIDHCHKTDEVRGILCRHCNLMLGHAKDNMEILEEAVNYLDGRN